MYILQSVYNNRPESAKVTPTLMIFSKLDHGKSFSTTISWWPWPISSHILSKIVQKTAQRTYVKWPDMIEHGKALCWWLLLWWQFKDACPQGRYVGDFSPHVGAPFNFQDWSPTSHIGHLISQSCHQHIPSPTAVTNINVAGKFFTMAHRIIPYHRKIQIRELRGAFLVFKNSEKWTRLVV